MEILGGLFKRRGVGMAAVMQASGYGPVVPDYANAKVELTLDGKILVYCGVVDMGQGNASTNLQIVGRSPGTARGSHRADPARHGSNAPQRVRCPRADARTPLPMPLSVQQRRSRTGCSSEPRICSWRAAKKI